MKSLSEYAQYLEANEIELGLLLCNELSDDVKDGITYKEVKQSSKVLDVVELGRKRTEEAEADENNEHHDPVGYDEVLQVLRSVLWSNVQTRGAHNNMKDEYKNSGSGETSASGEKTETGNIYIEYTPLVL